MRSLKNFLILFFLNTLGWAQGFALESTPVRKDHLTVSLVSEYDEVAADAKDFKLAVKFKIDDHWHIYWKNPGDSGTSPKVEWITEEKLNFKSFEWPLPQPIAIEPLLNYGYERVVLLPLDVDVLAPLAKKEISIQANLKWLICKVECIPGKAEVVLKIPVGANKISEASNEIYRSISQVPIKKHDIKFKTNFEDDKIILTFMSKNIIFSSYEKFYFFPGDGTLINHASPQESSVDDKNHLVLKIDKNEAFQGMPSQVEGVLSLDRKGEPKISFEVASVEKGKMTSSYFLILLFAFLGGMILNLMPCVFPVISIKILSFVEASKKSDTKLYTHGWAYTFGILASFFVLSSVLLALRSFGENLGWGFQLQSPLFVVCMIILFFLMGLNLFGFFEIGENLGSVGGNLQRGKDLRASFFTGILATIVATPCTAPFMGTALGVAITLPTLAALLVFLMIGAGMAFPYLVLTYSPKLLRFLPKPGVWMKYFKQFLSFPMFATVIWLFWVLSFQVQSDILMYVGFYLLLLALAIWFYKIKNEKKWHIAIYVILALATGILTKQIHYRMEAAQAAPEEHANWKSYSEKEISDLEKSNQSYFIDFTAAWCLTCQVNKKLVLNTDLIQKEFKTKNVTLFKADWTNQDPVVTKALEKFDRNSVPLYILYNPKTAREIVLPEILTDEIILDHLEQL